MIKENYINKFRKKIKENGLKKSKQREEVVNIFIEQENHIDAESLYEKIKKKHPKIGHTTVYRTLKLLCDLEMAISHSFFNNMAFFEPIIDNATHHDHFICTNCKEIQEFENEEIEKLQTQVAKENGFKMTRHILNIYGVCKKCLKK